MEKVYRFAKKMEKLDSGHKPSRGNAFIKYYKDKQLFLESFWKYFAKPTDENYIKVFIGDNLYRVDRRISEDGECAYYHHLIIYNFEE